MIYFFQQSTCIFYESIYRFYLKSAKRHAHKTNFDHFRCKSCLIVGNSYIFWNNERKFMCIIHEVNENLLSVFYQDENKF